MNTEHASEMELQEYALDKYGCSKQAIIHIEVCENCQAGVAAYRLLFDKIKKQPKPAFDFDVSALLLPQITAGLQPMKAVQPPVHAGHPASRTDLYFKYSMVVILFLIVGIPVYLFRKNIYYIFTGVSSFFLYTIIAAALIIVLLRIMDMHKRHQKRMKVLHFY
jgi:hypothetical protein